MPSATRRTCSTRSEAKPTTKPKKGVPKATNGRSAKKRRQDLVSEDEDEDEGAEESDAYMSGQDEHDEDDRVSLDSDALDDDEDDLKKSKPTRKRKSGASSPKKQKAGASPRKKRKVSDGDEADRDYLDLEDGQEIVGVVVQAPKTGHVPPGQISKNTLNFLAQLKKPECNDREWFRLNEPVYRTAEKEWKAFIEELTDVIVEADPQIPHLPPKDVTHRIYRDVRFSNDKTPYKTGFSASFSRSGRKGIFACYHISIKAGGESLLAAGSWQPRKEELDMMRTNIKRSSARLRKVISHPTFVGLFGDPKPHAKGLRQNIFGMDDELKVAPKGVDKTHPDIDLLKCRSFAVVHRFTDKQVLQEDFKEEVARMVGILRPFVYCLNDLMTVQNAADAGNDDDDEGEEDEEKDGEEEGEEEE